ncbi:hypothetical protein BD779DRAFT_1679029 [Infundibulicybe gibba]|nr:hypothetical protein BD779DRAFT_1679029 [Infundibulicybe gibba]
MSDTRTVTVLYCEGELQMLVSVPSSFTITEAKEAGSVELLDHIHGLPGVPPTLALGDVRADVYEARKIPDTTIGDPDASGESIQCSTPSQPLPRSPLQTSQSNPRPESDRHEVATMYCEERLQITLQIPSSSTVAEAKAAALKGMYKHLLNLLGVLVALDDRYVKVYPGVRTTGNTTTEPHPPACSTPDLKIGDICTSDKSIMIIVWPRAKPGCTIVPSPIMDALRNAVAELAHVTARFTTLKLLVEKHSKKSKSKRKKSKRKGPSSTHPPTNVAQDSASVDNGGIVGAFIMTEDRISEVLKAEDALFVTGTKLMESMEAELKKFDA